MSLSDLAIQLLGAVGFAAILISTRQARISGVLGWGMFGTAFLVPHWLLLGQPASSAMNGVYGLAMLLSTLALAQKTPRGLYWVVYPLALGLTVVSWRGWLDGFALAATLLGLWALSNSSMARLRTGVMLSHFCWLVVAVVGGSWFGILFSAAMIVSNAQRLRAERREREAAPSV